ncbi:MAG: hypothetical protein JWL58_1192 [Streptosporangiaceae bacterium]|jgi:hypothetical protein|nr:hypothetical protein [Streptosporangiaceae bacterium]
MTQAQAVAGENEVAATDSDVPVADRRSRVTTTLGKPWVIAVLTWLVATPIAAVIPGLLNLDPFSQRGADVPLALGGLVVVIVAGAALLRRGPGVDTVAGVAAGLFAAYIVLTLRTALHGTPFGFEGVNGDTGRITAMATRYTVSWGSTDGIVPGVPSEYPPLFPWLIGKLSVLSGVAAWRLMPFAEIGAVSTAVIAGFLLWLRHVRAPLALAIMGLGIALYGGPVKSYEVLILMIFLPWVLSTFLTPPRGRLHWLAAGAIGGLIVLVYYTYVVFALVGLLALLWTTWRREGRPYLVYVLKVAAVTAVLSCWFVVPYVWAMLHGGQQLDVFESSTISDLPLPFLEFSVLGLAQLAGLIGLLSFRRSVWWAGPLLLILFSTYLYRVINLIRYVATGHTGLFYYTVPLISMCLLVGCVLSFGELVSRLPERLTPSRSAGAVVLAALFVFAGFGYWDTWMPVNRWHATQAGPAKPTFSTSNGNANPLTASYGLTNSYTLHAHAQAFPNGAKPRFAGSAKDGRHTWPWFPTTPIQKAVEGVLGAGAAPRTLSYSEELFAFLPWKGYIGTDRGSSYGPVKWDARFAELNRIVAIKDPAQFAQASKTIGFGAIDVFILHREGADLVWRPLRSPGVLRFSPQQFGATDFVVVNDLPQNTVVAIRRPAG